MMEKYHNKTIETKNLPFLVAQKTIKVRIAETFSPRSPGDGYRAQYIVSNSAHTVVDGGRGQWGGANMFVDSVDTQTLPLPKDQYALVGYTGHRTNYTLVLHPEGSYPWLPELPETPDLNEQELKTLVVINGTKSGYRAQELDRKGLGSYTIENPAIAKLRDLGMITTNKNGKGIKVTAHGRTVADNA